MWSIDEAARVMGMPAHEVTAVAEVGDYHVVSTHDGQHTLITADGEAVLVTPGTTPAELAAKLGVNVDELGLPQGDDEGQEDGEPGDPPQGGEGGESPLEVPDGNADEVLAWVGQDADRLAAALEVEKARETPRKGLLAALEKAAHA